MHRRVSTLAVAALCVVASCSSGTGHGGTGGTDGGGGICVFGVEWNGVHYIDPAANGEPAELPEASGRYLGTGRDVCPEPGTSRTWRLYSIPGVSSDVAVTTEGARYLGVAEGADVPEELRMTHSPARTSPPAAPLPRWAQHCLPRARTSSHFLGMEIGKAKKLGERAGIGLVIIGAAGRCFKLPQYQLSNETLVVVDARDRVIATRRLAA